MLDGSLVFSINPRFYVYSIVIADPAFWFASCYLEMVSFFSKYQVSFVLLWGNLLLIPGPQSQSLILFLVPGLSMCFNGNKQAFISIFPTFTVYFIICWQHLRVMYFFKAFYGKCQHLAEKYLITSVQTTKDGIINLIMVGS